MRRIDDKTIHSVKRHISTGADGNVGAPRVLSYPLGRNMLLLCASALLAVLLLQAVFAVSVSGQTFSLPNPTWSTPWITPRPASPPSSYNSQPVYGATNSGPLRRFLGIESDDSDTNTTIRPDTTNIPSLTPGTWENDTTSSGPRPNPNGTRNWTPAPSAPMPPTLENIVPSSLNARPSPRAVDAHPTSLELAPSLDLEWGEIWDRTPEQNEVLRRGRELEYTDNWSDVLRFYENAIREMPDFSELQDRCRNARIHCDVARRYRDPSFLRLIQEESFVEALDVYEEVGGKMTTHHVSAPSWSDMVEHGVDGLDIALHSDALWSRTGLPTPSDERIEEFFTEVDRTLSIRIIEYPSDAKEAIVGIAALGRRMLGVPESLVAYECLCGAANSFDAYSCFLTPNQLSEMYSQIDGNFVGLGVELKVNEDDCLRIVRVITGSPAEQSGVRTGDRILAVDGHEVCTMAPEEAADMLQGEIDTICRLQLQSGEETPRLIDVLRRRVEVPSVDQVQVFPESDGVAYLKLTCFQKTTVRDLDQALWNLHQQGMQCLIMDLRGNPGGLLNSSVEVVDKFIERGTVVSTRGRSPGESQTFTAREAGTWGVPLVVLIDGDSASAAEIFAGAIRDYDRGTLIGERSYGKGSVQGIFPLASGESGIRITTAKFYSPQGLAFSQVGVTPDLSVYTTSRPIQDGTTANTYASRGTREAFQNDLVLNAGLEEAGRLLHSR